MKYLFLALILIGGSVSQEALAREQISIVGSSTVYPFSAAVAEKFGKTSGFRTPVVESTGTGGGFKLFCAGVGPNAPDITDASRAILPEERSNCERAGIRNILEIPVGFDGIVIGNSKSSPHFALTKLQIFNALARQVEVDGKLVDNPYQNWSDIDPALPRHPIEVYGTPPTSGTRDAFVELVMDKACSGLLAFKAAYPDERERKKQCGLIREDGKYIEAGENGNIIIQKLVSNPGSLGIFGYSFLEQNEASVQAATIENVLPSFDAIRTGRYAISRKLYIYVKQEHLGIVPGIKEFLREYTGEASFGVDGYLTEQGLIPLGDMERARIRQGINFLK